MIIPKHFHRKRQDDNWKPDVSMYNTQATSFLKLQLEGKQKIAHKEKSTLESLLPLVAVSLTPFALQSQSCPNNPGIVNTCDVSTTRVEQSIDLEGDGQVDIMVSSEIIDQNSGAKIGALVAFVNTSTWLTAGYVGYAPYTYFNAYASGATINGANVNFSSQGVARLGCPNTNFESWLDYNPIDPAAYPNPNGAWNGQSGSTPGLFMAFKKDGVLGFVELIYTEGPNTVTIGSYGMASSAAITSIVAGDCSSLVDNPTIIITEDADNDGVITSLESSGAVDISITLPGSAVAGDDITVDDGINAPFTITLTAAQVTAGVITSTVPLPANNTTLTVTVTHTPAGGSPGPAASDVALIDLTPPIANDDCSSPTILPITADCTTPLSASLTGATISPELPDFICGNGSSVTAKDVWFQLTVPSSGNVIVSTSASTNTPAIDDTVIQAYSGSSCGALTLVACNDDNPAVGLFSILDMSGLTPGSSLFIRVKEFDAVTEGDFNICAISPCPDYSTATGTPLTGIQNVDADYESDDAIDSDQIIEAPAIQVDYDSAVSVEMLEGFEVKDGVVFHSFIDGCVGNGL